MAVKKFIKDNFVLIIGLTLPVLLMVGFMLAASLPTIISEPPKYDLIFSTPDNNSHNLPVSLKLTVDQNGALNAQIAPVHRGRYGYGNWKKLYLYEASTQKVRELPLPYPTNMDKITEVTEHPIEAASGMRLDASPESPDGYSLSYRGYSRSGLIGELFVGSRYNSEPRLRKGSSSVQLIKGDGSSDFYYGSIELHGWVIER